MNLIAPFTFPHCIKKSKSNNFKGAVGDLNCAAQNLYAEDKLEDPAFINYQMQCLLDRGECDDIGNLVKRKFKFKIIKY